MDQNFSLMAQSRANYYTAGSPVQFVRVELLKGDVTGEVAVCLTFKNVGTEPLTGFIIHFKCKDASGQILCEDDFYYEQLNVQPGELFGADDAVFVSDTPVSSVEIEQDRAFLNAAAWICAIISVSACRPPVCCLALLPAHFRPAPTIRC